MAENCNSVCPFSAQESASQGIQLQWNAEKGRGTLMHYCWFHYSPRVPSSPPPLGNISPYKSFHLPSFSPPFSVSLPPTPPSLDNGLLLCTAVLEGGRGGCIELSHPLLPLSRHNILSLYTHTEHRRRALPGVVSCVCSHVRALISWQVEKTRAREKHIFGNTTVLENYQAKT